MKAIAAFVLTAVVATFASPCMAQFAKPEDAVKYRQSALSVMGTHFGRIAAMASGKAAYDAKEAADNAAIVEFMSRLPWAGFVEGSDKVGNTKALPEVWSQNAKFKEASEKLMAETTKLNAAAKLGTLEALKAAVASTGGACKNCHDSFRAK